MKAVVIEPRDGGATLAVRDVPEPTPKPSEVKVAVRAAGVNRADLRRAVTHFASSEGKGAAAIAGLEMTGEVVATGADVRELRVGDRVMAMTGSAYADFVCIDARLALKVPPTLDWVRAAAIPVSYIASHDALANAGALREGESVFINGASSGAGIAAAQIARWLGARVVLGTAGSDDKLRRLRDVGCDDVIDHRAGHVAAAVRARTDDKGADLVIDIVGGEQAMVNVDAAAIGGRIVCLGRVAGARGTLDFDEFSRKRVRMIGVTFRTRTFAERVQAVASFAQAVLPAIASGAIAPVIDRVMPMSDADAAQAYMRGNGHFGKIVLTA